MYSIILRVQNNSWPLANFRLFL